MSILKSEDFLITTSVGTVSRKIIWPGDEPTELDLPNGWLLERTQDKLRIRNLSQPFNEEGDTAFEFDIPGPGQRALIELPSALPRGLNRPLDVEILRMKAPDPVYMIRHQYAPQYPSKVPKQLMQFYGERYILVRYRPVPPTRSVTYGNMEVFEYERTPTGYAVFPRAHGVRLKTANENIHMDLGSRYDMNEHVFFSSTIIYGVHWWRYRMVPTPDAMPPVETAETEEDIREEIRFQLTAVSFISLFLAALLVLYFQSKHDKPAPKVVSVEIKKPVVVPPTKEALNPPPPPPKEEPPKVVEVKPEPPKPEPKPKPQPKVAKKKTPPKKIVAKEPPPKTPEPPPAPVKTAKAEPPANTGNAAAEKAAETAAMKQQLMKKLGFLSTSSKRTVADPTNYDTPTEGRFTKTPVMGGEVSKSNSLDKIVKDAPGDGNIRTNSSRTVASSVDFGTKGKGLNDVQGKVSMGELSSGGSKMGSSLGGSGIVITGEGTVSDGEIEKAIAKFIKRFNNCYEKALLTDSSLGGKIRMQWTITKTGSGTNPKVVSSQLNNEDLHNCIGKVLKEIPFPKPKGGTVTVSRLFQFSSAAL